MTKERALKKATLRREWAEKAESKAKAILTELDNDPIASDFNFWSEPIKIGHHSERRHRRLREGFIAKKQKAFDLLDKAKDHREKADNLETFANTHKGDAERRRELVRQENDTQITIGTKVVDGVFNRSAAEVVKVNAKSYRLRFPDGWEITRDKSYVQKI